VTILGPNSGSRNHEIRLPRLIFGISCDDYNLRCFLQFSVLFFFLGLVLVMTAPEGLIRALIQRINYLSARRGYVSLGDDVCQHST
jgi:hypothetical protein